MKYRKFGRLDWNVSEVGYGMWGLAEWSGTDDQDVLKSLNLAVELGCNFLIQHGYTVKVRVNLF